MIGCHKCGYAFFRGHVAKVLFCNDSDFKGHLCIACLEFAECGHSLVDLHSDWCDTCKFYNNLKQEGKYPYNAPNIQCLMVMRSKNNDPNIV